VPTSTNPVITPTSGAPVSAAPVSPGSNTPGGYGQPPSYAPALPDPANGPVSGVPAPRGASLDVPGRPTSPAPGRTTPPPNGLVTPPANGLGTPPGNGLGTPPGNGLGTPPGNGLGTPPGNGLGASPGNGLGASLANDLGRSDANGLGSSLSNDLGRSAANGLGAPPASDLGMSPSNDLGRSGGNSLGSALSNELGRSAANGLGTPPASELGRSATNGLGTEPVTGRQTPGLGVPGKQADELSVTSPSDPAEIASLPSSLRTAEDIDRRPWEEEGSLRPPAPRRSASLEDAEPVRRGRRAAPDDDDDDDGQPAEEQAMRPGDVAAGHIAFWDDDATRHFRAAWHEVKAEFVDDPVRALTRAHDLLTDAVNELTEAMLAERDELDPLRGTATPDTESMRMAMRGYREFLDRILAL
jgi:hypothetical protein